MNIGFFLTLSWYKVLEKEKITPLLKEGKNVITDGYFYKQLVKFSRAGINEHYLPLFDSLVQPNLNVLINVSPQVSWSTKKDLSIVETGAFDGFKGHQRDNFIEYQQSLSDIYFSIANERQWDIINRENILYKDTSEEVFENIKTIIESKITNADGRSII